MPEDKLIAVLEGQSEYVDLLRQFFDNSPIPTFVIDRHHKVVIWNRALEVINGLVAKEVIGTDKHWTGAYDEKRPTMADLLLDGALAEETQRDRVDSLYPAGWRASPIVEGAYESEGRFPHRGGGTDHWLYVTAAPLRDKQGRVVGAIETLQDITERKYAEADNERYKHHLEDLVMERTRELMEVNQALKTMNQRLEEAHNQLLHSEKMASIGQLAAGVAHEINNPLGFVSSNLTTLESYASGLMSLVEVYERNEHALSERLDQVQEAKRSVGLDYMRTDLFELLNESKDGLARVKKIVQDLKEFSRGDQQGWEFADLHAGLDSTLNVIHSQLPSQARIVREYGALPEVECNAHEINQVFMNLILNAAQAIAAEGEIRLRTGCEGDQAWVDVIDNGCGIPPENLKRIFDPFFTTRPVGAGTGLGLSLAYSLVRKHKGRIEVESQPGQGARFRVWLPLRQSRQEGG